MKEIWKDIEGYEGYYQISTFGNVRSFHFKNPKLLKLRNINGYKFVCLCINQRRRTVPIHRLVAKAFIPNPKNKPNINHINFIRNDNSIFNLEWCTQKENVMHSYKNGRMHPLKNWENIFSYDHHSSKEVAQYDLDGKFINKYGSVHEANRITKINTGDISSVCNGKKKMAGGYKWEYPEEIEIVENEK